MPGRSPSGTAAALPAVARRPADRPHGPPRPRRARARPDRRRHRPRVPGAGARAGRRVGERFEAGLPGPAALGRRPRGAPLPGARVQLPPRPAPGGGSQHADPGPPRGPLRAAWRRCSRSSSPTRSTSGWRCSPTTTPRAGTSRRRSSTSTARRERAERLGPARRGRRLWRRALRVAERHGRRTAAAGAARAARRRGRAAGAAGAATLARSRRASPRHAHPHRPLHARGRRSDRRRRRSRRLGTRRRAGGAAAGRRSDDDGDEDWQPAPRGGRRGRARRGPQPRARAPRPTRPTAGGTSSSPGASGGSLADRLAGGRAPSADETVRIVVRVARGSRRAAPRGRRPRRRAAASPILFDGDGRALARPGRDEPRPQSGAPEVQAGARADAGQRRLRARRDRRRPASPRTGSRRRTTSNGRSARRSRADPAQRPQSAAMFAPDAAHGRPGDRPPR